MEQVLFKVGMKLPWVKGTYVASFFYSDFDLFFSTVTLTYRMKHKLY